MQQFTLTWQYVPVHAYISGTSNFLCGNLPYHDFHAQPVGLRQGQCKLLYHTLDRSDGNRFYIHSLPLIALTTRSLIELATFRHSYNRWNTRLKGVVQLVMWHCM